MRLLFIQTGGTIDKLYPRSTQGYAFEFGDFSATQEIIENEFKAIINFDADFITVCKKDSTEMNDNDRQNIVDIIKESDSNKYYGIIITHGTDTMIQTAKYIDKKLLYNNNNKYCIVLTGSMKPAKFIDSDAKFNLGAAISVVQLIHKYKHYGVYLTMNGNVFTCNNVKRNYQNGFFVSKL